MFHLEMKHWRINLISRARLLLGTESFRGHHKRRLPGFVRHVRSFHFPKPVSRFLYREADSTKKEATRLTTGYWHGSMLPVPWQTSAFDFCIGGQVAAEASATGYFRFFTFPSDLHSKLFHDRKLDNKSERKGKRFFVSVKRIESLMINSWKKISIIFSFFFLKTINVEVAEVEVLLSTCDDWSNRIQCESFVINWVISTKKIRKHGKC